VKKLLVTILLATGIAADPEVTVKFEIEAYIEALESIDAQLESNQLVAAQTAAREMIGTEVVWAKGTFLADGSLLDAIAEAQRAQGAHRVRLLTTISELRRASGMDVARGDRKLLEQIAAEQEPPELPKGGEIPTKLERDVPLLERIAESIGDMLEWVRKQLRKAIEWILDLLPRPDRPGATAGLSWIVWAVVGAIVVLVVILAFSVLRKSQKNVAVPIAASAPLGSKRDEDPLSRGAQEWERYAGELAAAGQFREAIRAWYHAVLVTCYAAGILHFRKGRTNWEYVASLSPSLVWRPDVIELTRRFEKEWYGGEQSARDAYEECEDRARTILDAVRREMRGAA
jgi:hypothetical protein